MKRRYRRRRVLCITPHEKQSQEGCGEGGSGSDQGGSNRGIQRHRPFRVNRDIEEIASSRGSPGRAGLRSATVAGHLPLRRFRESEYSEYPKFISRPGRRCLRWHCLLPQDGRPVTNAADQGLLRQRIDLLAMVLHFAVGGRNQTTRSEAALVLKQAESPSRTKRRGGRIAPGTRSTWRSFVGLAPRYNLASAANNSRMALEIAVT